MAAEAVDGGGHDDVVRQRRCEMSDPARPARNVVPVHGAYADGSSWSDVTAWQDGAPLDPEATGYATTLLDQLAWWADALRTARRATPYPGGA
ncbi:hypothetical protein O7634_24750 [Micromonospora sp. WMMD1120]|uniref:hypothetical protein n=1 Tax=Micromonospora sp. WMMD1120 TaxID=3016106 RepID=UPI0024170080|nr:hypothetical protein [Micromonospora sp. WMMD1120]MDG4809974.1 hypothetical protein [Micromonospora sp. WMMD1120]